VRVRVYVYVYAEKLQVPLISFCFLVTNKMQKISRKEISNLGAK
jgi:hypothetical protein